MTDLCCDARCCFFQFAAVCAAAVCDATYKSAACCNQGSDYEYSMAQIVINIDVVTVQNFRSSTGNHFQNNPLITLNCSYQKRM